MRVIFSVTSAVKHSSFNVLFTDNIKIIDLFYKATTDPTLCPNKCGRLYKGANRKYNLKRHLIYECGVNPQFKCIICQKLFRYKHSLQYHIGCVHKKKFSL